MMEREELQPIKRIFVTQKEYFWHFLGKIYGPTKEFTNILVRIVRCRFARTPLHLSHCSTFAQNVDSLVDSIKGFIKTML